MEKETEEVLFLSLVTYNIFLMVYHSGLMFNKQREIIPSSLDLDFISFYADPDVCNYV